MLQKLTTFQEIKESLDLLKCFYEVDTLFVDDKDCYILFQFLSITMGPLCSFIPGIIIHSEWETTFVHTI